MERDEARSYLLRIYRQFQLTRSRGAWPERQATLFTAFTFQLTRSRGAWLQRCNFKKFICYFNSHAHVERDSYTQLLTTQHWHFNSHAHVERDRCNNATGEVNMISTHTLTWSVTLHGRTCQTPLIFQLTRSRGAWLCIYSDWIVKICISTHTLTWSVTFQPM